MPANTSITELEALITEARVAYYNSDEPTMSDAEYDALCDELTKLDPANKALTAIGAPAASEWVKVKHPSPLGSLDKLNTPAQVSEWVADKLGNGATLVSEKLDGISIGLCYTDGKLTAALTRGDGLIGEDILSNAVKMCGVMSKLKAEFNGTVRGEIVLTKTDHRKHFADYTNARNGASGISRRFDGEGSEHLTVMAYDVMPSDDTAFATEQSKFEWLADNGFLAPGWKVCGKASDINDLWQQYQDKTRNELDYDIDGLVIGVQDLAHPLVKESHDLNPRSKRAFKFLNQFIKTVVKEVRWTPGASSRVAPVCWFKPVSVMGATLEKASVYNAAYIKRLGIGVGAEVMVCRANDVIPRVEKVIKPAKEVASPPDFCPSCDSKLLVQGEYLICPNRDCKPQVVGRVARWVSELNILELGDTLIEKLVESGLVKTPADLYRLTAEQLAALDRMGKQSALNVHNSIWGCNPVALELFLGSLSIPFIGSSMIKMLIGAGYDTLGKIRSITRTQIEAIKGYGSGSVKAAALYEGLSNSSGLIDELLDNGVQIKQETKMEAKSDRLNGVSVVFSGKSSKPRKELQAMVIENGGTCPSSVSKGVAYLVLADPSSTSTKAEKARAIGTQVISEEQFMQLVGQ